MKWFRIFLATFLAVVAFLGVNFTAYANDPPESSLKVEITIDGDNSDVRVGIGGSNPEVWINGQNLNDPSIIYHESGANESWVKGQINEAIAALYPLIEEQAARLGLTAEGLAKVIITIQGYNSQFASASSVDRIYSRLAGVNSILGDLDIQIEGNDDRLESVDSLLSSLEETQDTFTNEMDTNYQALASEIEQVEREYNMLLAIASGVSLLVITGLGIGFGISLHHLGKRLDDAYL